MITLRHGTIVALLVGSMVGGTAGATILTAASSHAGTKTTASLQREAPDSTGSAQTPTTP